MSMKKNGITTPFDLLATDLLVQPSNLLVSPTATAHCWLVFSALSPSGPPGHFQQNPRQSDPCQWVPSLYQCRGSFSPGVGLCILLLLKSWGSCWMIVPTCVGASGQWCCPQAYQLAFSILCHFHTWQDCVSCELLRVSQKGAEQIRSQKRPKKTSVFNEPQGSIWTIDCYMWSLTSYPVPHTYLSVHPPKLYCSNLSTRMLREFMSKPSRSQDQRSTTLLSPTDSVISPHTAERSLGMTSP